MTRKYLSGSSDSLNAEETCCDASFLILFSIGYTGPSFTKGEEITLQFVTATTLTVKHNLRK